MGYQPPTGSQSGVHACVPTKGHSLASTGFPRMLAGEGSQSEDQVEGLSLD
jgi:hypothetical protein